MELHRVHRRIGTIAVTAVVATTALIAAPTASAVEDVTTAREAGQDRFGTAAEIATAAFPSGSDTVLVASGRAFPDALAGAALGFPVLLTERDSLPSVTSDALADLDAERAIILGGTAAVSTAVANALEDDVATVQRIAGDDRYETAAEIAEAIGSTQVSDLDGKATAIIATGLNFADALAGGPLAAEGAGTGVHPILLTNTGVPTSTEAALEALDIEQVIILGGTGAVSTAVESELEDITGNPAVRLAGSNRYATAVEVAEAAIADFGFPADDVLLANGLVFADALAGGPFGAATNAPIILTDVNLLPAPSEAFFEDHADTIENIIALGGTAAVSNSTLGAAEQAAERETAQPQAMNETVVISPQGAASVANGSAREYTVTGLTTPVDIVLVECADITRGTATTNTTFRNTNANSIADATSVDGGAPDEADVANVHLSSVNGTARTSVESPAEPNNDYADDVDHTDGVVRFVVTGPDEDSTASVCVQPVVFVDANGDEALNVPVPPAATNTALPNEAFGVGGSTSFSRGAAAAGQFGPHNIDTLDKASRQFTACAIPAQSGENELPSDDCKSFRYDPNDVFQISGSTVNITTFEAALSLDDDVQGTYAVDPAGVSTFNLTDEDNSSGRPTITTARASSPGNTEMDAGDVHELVFSEPMSEATAQTGTYTVQGGLLIATQTIDCASSTVECGLSSDFTTLRVHLLSGFVSTINYPVTITAVTNMTDRDASPKTVDLENSPDDSINVATLTDTVRPAIITVAFVEDADSCSGFGQKDDGLKLTFGTGTTAEAIAMHFADTVAPVLVTEDELKAILGPDGQGTVADDLDYSDTTAVVATVSGSTLILTVNEALAHGVENGDNVHGTSNPLITDTAGNAQTTGTQVLPAAAATCP